MTTFKKLSLSEIYAPIQDELKNFSDRLKEELASDDDLIKGIHEHLLKMTGKFMRPVLALLSSHAAGKHRDEVVRLAVSIELIHTATLVHDDIIDDSLLRRNQPSIYSKWGREISIVAGDYLYAKAFMLLASFQDPWISKAFSECAHIMCEGEMKQIEKRNDFTMPESDYLRIIHKKTASLFQAACMGGSYLAGGQMTHVKSLGDYGYNLGMAFQIVDDCLDLVGETESLGKTTGLDILKNDVTLPMLYLFNDLKKNDRDKLLSDMRANKEGLLGQIQNLANEHRCVQRAMQKAKAYSQEALEALKILTDSPFKTSLTQLTHHCMDRVR